jgi:phosphoglycerol transferase MdoB-like AlkP superfamily enzyme
LKCYLCKSNLSKNSTAISKASKKMNFKKNIPTTIRQFLQIYFSALLIFTAFRFILFLTELGRINADVATGSILISFLMGIRFDLVISGYVLILPFFVLSILSFFNNPYPIINKTLFYFIFGIFTLAFLVCAVDIPYFNQFFSRFSITAFEWFDSPAFVFKMIVEEPRYWLAAIPFFLFVFGFYKILRRILSNPTETSTLSIAAKAGLTVLCLGFIFLGIRGRVEKKSPIRIGTAYFSNNPFLNQLGLNPNFTLIRSYLDSKEENNKTVQLMNDSAAVANVQRYLNIQHPDKNLPLLRQRNVGETKPNNYNVVLVIMESMSAAKMERGGNHEHLTPFLDSISHRGYYFNNTYTAGIHTFNGIFSSLFSMPGLFRQHPMKESAILKYHGMFSTLKEKGYSTAYFTTHDGQFDNVEGFLKANDCETVISQANYPEAEIKTTLGVPDKYLFEFSMPVLNKLSEKNKPFVATFMTASDHGPYYLPDYFKPRSKDIKKQITEYADYSLQKLIEMSSKQKWFKNTIFVFVADHGAAMDNTYELALDYNHAPLLFYAPGIIKDPKTLDCMAGQIDIFPTIMGLLKQPYANNTLGIDLLHESRPYIFFNADDKYGVIDRDWLLIGKTDGTKKLYKYQNKDTHNYATEDKDRAEEMNKYAQSNLQTFQYMILKKKQ